MRYLFVGAATVVLAGGMALGQQAGQQPGAPRVSAQPNQPQQPNQPGQPGQIRQQPDTIRPGAAQPNPTQPGFAQPGQQRQAGNADQQIAAKIYGACHNEVELAKFVQSRLQTKEAKEFAERMIKDHTPDCETYQKFAGHLAGQQDSNRRAAGGQLDWVSVHQELAKQCLESAKKELSAKESAEIDHCYMGHQAMAHMAMKDALTVLRNHASKQLAQQIDQSLQGVETHLKEAKQILEQEKDRPAERVSRRPDSDK